MSKQVEQIRAEVERRIKSWEAGVKYEGDAGDCQSRVTELTDLKKFIDSLPKEDGPKKPYFDKEYIESKIKAFSEAHKGETAEQIEAECRGEEAPIEDTEEETHSLQEWAQLMAERPDLRAEFDKMCPPQPIQGSIAPEADLEAEAERFLKTLPWRTNTPPIPDEYLDEKTYLAIARHFAKWGRKKVLQEIHDGKYNVADKHIAAWLKDE